MNMKYSVFLFSTMNAQTGQLIAFKFDWKVPCISGKVLS